MVKRKKCQIRKVNFHRILDKLYKTKPQAALIYKHVAGRHRLSYNEQTKGILRSDYLRKITLGSIDEGNLTDLKTL